MLKQVIPLHYLQLPGQSGQLRTTNQVSSFDPFQPHPCSCDRHPSWGRNCVSSSVLSLGSEGKAQQLSYFLQEILDLREVSLHLTSGGSEGCCWLIGLHLNLFLGSK